MLAIKNNVMAANAARYLGRSYDALAQSVERLSSGLRINSAKDDAAGMAVRELMRADIAVIQQGGRNAQDGISMLQTMEGAMATVDNALVRMKQLAEQASTGSYSSAQRDIMNNEFAEMAAEIDRIATSTKFNDISMLDNEDEVTIRFGTADDDAITVTGADMTQEGLGIQTGTGKWFTTASWNNAVADKDETPALTVVGADKNLVLDIAFTDSEEPNNNQDTIQVTFAGAADDGATYSLQDIADKINLASQNPTHQRDEDGNWLGYSAAQIVEGEDGDGNPEYVLKLSARDSNINGMGISINALSDPTSIEGIFGETKDDNTNLMTLEDPNHLGEKLFQKYDATDGWGDDISGTRDAGINILNTDDAATALDSVTTAIGLKDIARAAFGYKINRLESTGEVLSIQAENLMTAESRISDVDVATEMAKLTRNQVLAQAGTAMLVQANSIPQMALTLLR
jgi:flagellin